MFFTDYAPLDNTRVTADGYLLAQPRVVRAGVTRWSRAEVERNAGLVLPPDIGDEIDVGQLSRRRDKLQSFLPPAAAVSLERA